MQTKSQTLEAIANSRNGKQSVIFTNGCFDILHVGHVRYLNEAKSLGDVLVVGLNSDDSVRRLKGPERPVNDQNDRAEVLLGLSAVDHVIVFEEDTPEQLIEQVRPDVLVKGGDWPIDKIVGSSFVQSYGGTVKSLSFHDGHSTTSIIERSKTES